MSAHSVPFPREFPVHEARAVPERRLTRLEFALLAFVVASFAYELPLVTLIKYDRLNPRLFDVAGFLLAAYWLVAGWRIDWRHPLLAPWLTITAIFTMAALASALFLPRNLWLYSVFFMLKYLEGAIVLVIFLSAPLDERTKRRLLWVALIGGTWVAFYAVLQLVGIASTTRVLPTGIEIERFEEGVYSTLGPTYFHAGQFGILSALVGFTLIRSGRGAGRLAAGLLAPFAAIPAIVSGSRAGLVGLGLAAGLLVIQRQYRSHLGTYVVAAFLAIAFNIVFSMSLTKERLDDTVDTENTVVARLMKGPRTLEWALDEHGPRLVAMGGGFYVVPLGGHWRIGYGNHNIYLFPLEQAGLFAFVAALVLWLRLGISLWRFPSRQDAVDLDRHFSRAMLAYLGALLVIGLAGQVFWLGFGTEHLTFYQLLLFGLALVPTGASAPDRDPSRRRLEETLPGVAHSPFSPGAVARNRTPGEPWPADR